MYEILEFLWNLPSYKPSIDLLSQQVWQTIFSYFSIHTIVIRYTIMICEAVNSEKVFLTLASCWNKENLNVLKKLKRPASPGIEPRTPPCMACAATNLYMYCTEIFSRQQQWPCIVAHLTQDQFTSTSGFAKHPIPNTLIHFGVFVAESYGALVLYPGHM